MTDPVRWSESDEASALERELLGAAQQSRLPESERRALWARIALSVPTLPAPPPDATSSTLGVSLAKGALLASLAAGLGWGALALFAAPAATRPATPAVATGSATVSSPPPPPTVVVTPSPSETPSPRPAATLPPRASETPSQLREESAAVLEARAALRAGDAPRCLALLERAKARFPRGALGQEREALAIEALAVGGQREVARRRAAAFLRAHPRSPYVADLRRIAED